MAEGATRGRNPFRRRPGQGASAPPKNDGAPPEQVATRFLVELHRAFQQGHVSRDTEAHLRHTFRSTGWDAEPQEFSGQVDREIERLEREVSVLKKLRSESFGS
jgi:hypothetical protein